MADLFTPPESMRPDRPEVMSYSGSSLSVEIEPGVKLECLVGAHNLARGLTTGIVTFDPAVTLRYHTHPFTESITLLDGQAIAVVEGREYEMSRLDNVVIPRGIAHQIKNLSEQAPAVFQVALASDSPSRTIVPDTYPRRLMNLGEVVSGLPERYNHFRSASRFEAGPNTSFIDFFNENLMPGLEVSGGYGQFLPGGRLPSHVHDFDESICIIEGVATCIVEGRAFKLSGNATAMVPRGRVHYFINESDQPMSMLWVYAGPLPIRLVVDERCATLEGNPWKSPKSS